MIHPSQMTAQEWQDWIEFCVKEGKIDSSQLRGNRAERDAQYGKAWELAVKASEVSV